MDDSTYLLRRNFLTLPWTTHLDGLHVTLLARPVHQQGPDLLPALHLPLSHLTAPGSAHLSGHLLTPRPGIRDLY